MLLHFFSYVRNSVCIDVSAVKCPETIIFLQCMAELFLLCFDNFTLDSRNGKPRKQPVKKLLQWSPSITKINYRKDCC